MNRLTLNIDNHKTEVLIGQGLMNTPAMEKYNDAFYIIDENVFSNHRQLFLNRNVILIPSGEKHKSLGYSENVFRKLIEAEADRGSFFIGVGGGLVTDLTGFVASAFMRGVKFGFVSTTLLGQVDASIGGKNGVNFDGYKNMVGFINQPEFVYCDLDLLETLSRDELISGFAEVIKYGVISDASLFTFIEESYKDILQLKEEPLRRAITESCKIKIGIVSSDVSEQGNRKLLNFGHTIGHAIEKLTGMLHGKAVAIGMVLASRLSVNLGYLSGAEADRIERLIQKTGLPVQTDLSPVDIYETLLKDKKRSGNEMHFILAENIGRAFIHKMPLNDLKSAINDLY
ncbi:MAG TPA: 3-dehydroquinate synthase [Bacteroidales bacterium]|nr:3-dehydroquinate synthase [Bacteroidales bacterium]